MPDETGDRRSRGLVGERGPELHLPEDLGSLPVMAVLKGSPAWGGLLRMCRTEIRPGQIIPVTDEEMRSLREDVLVLGPAKVKRGESRAARERRLLYFKERNQRPEVKARAKMLRNTPERLARAKARTQQPEAMKKDRDRARRAYWRKHHPDQPVPPGRIEKEHWFKEHDERLYAAENPNGGE